MAMASGDDGGDCLYPPLGERRSEGCERDHVDDELLREESGCLEACFSDAVAKPLPVRSWLAGPFAEASNEVLCSGPRNSNTKPGGRLWWLGKGIAYVIL